MKKEGNTYKRIHLEVRVKLSRNTISNWHNVTPDPAKDTL